jgi:hypothetical protein
MTIFFHRRKKKVEKKQESSSHTASPYIFEVENLSNKDNFVNVLDQRYLSPTIQAQDKVKLTYGIPSITFGQFLHTLQSMPIMVAVTRLISNNIQLRKGLSICTRNINGSRLQKSFDPQSQLDCYGNESKQVDYRYSFMLNLNTEIKIELLPKEKVQFLIYPEAQPFKTPVNININREKPQEDFIGGLDDGGFSFGTSYFEKIYK